MDVIFNGVQKRYDSDFRLDVVRLEIARRDRLGLVGNNGAGKTTMLLLMLGLLRFQKGDVLLDGDSVRTFSLSWRSKTSSYLSESSLIPFLNPAEYWRFVGDAYGIERDEQLQRLAGYDGFVELAAGSKARKKYIRDYSQGNRKKIGLVAAMMVRPSLLVLDEPFTGLDPRSRASLEDLLLALNAEHGTTLVISSHDLVHVVDVSSRILLIEAGRLLFDGASNRETLRFIHDHLTGTRLERAAF